jgi:hypothetical protein
MNTLPGVKTFSIFPRVPNSHFIRCIASHCNLERLTVDFPPPIYLLTNEPTIYSKIHAHDAPVFLGLVHLLNAGMSIGTLRFNKDREQFLEILEFPGSARIDAVHFLLDIEPSAPKSLILPCLEKCIDLSIPRITFESVNFPGNGMLDAEVSELKDVLPFMDKLQSIQMNNRRSDAGLIEKYTITPRGSKFSRDFREGWDIVSMSVAGWFYDSTFMKEIAAIAPFLEELFMEEPEDAIDGEDFVGVLIPSSHCETSYISSPGDLRSLRRVFRAREALDAS